MVDIIKDLCSPRDYSRMGFQEVIKMNPNDENWASYCEDMNYILDAAEKLGMDVPEDRSKVAIDIPFVTEVIRRAMEMR